MIELKCGCKIEECLATVCEEHYSKFMGIPMERELVTVADDAMKILKKLGILSQNTIEANRQ